jgi:tRNA (guanine37-N1)-methyltransferase
MLLKPEPIAAAIEHAKKSNSSAKVILLTPSGQTYKQSVAQNLSAESGLILICGRYEGVDERVTTIVDMELSVGNYVLTGGEIPAMVVVDSVVRLIPGVLGGETSAEIESFSDDKTLEYAQYTKPEEWRGMNVPPILLSGNHQEIAEWRRQQSIEKTKLRDEQNK